ncbi:MAG: hypothetical protein NTY02_10460 [Acidobacteria bacterium]|nr:hypothetical protein [Acidobacteriota bacterium]
MSANACDLCRARILADEPVAAHLEDCADCRAWHEAYRAGVEVWRGEEIDAFADGVLVRTSMLDALIAELPSLVEMDPGPGFTERVLLHTSKKPATAIWRDRWLALVRRPRFAWEAAYVATLCWVLIFGNPVAALEWGTSRVSAIARERVTGTVSRIQADLDTWQVRLVLDSSAEAGGDAPPATRVAGALERAWRAGSAWIGRIFTPIVEALTEAFKQMAEWFSGAAPQARPPSDTEPAGTPVRSPQ